MFRRRTTNGATMIAGIAIAVVFSLAISMSIFLLTRLPAQEATLTRAGSPGRWGKILIALFVVIWVAGVISLDLRFARAFARHFHAATYVPVEGRVLRSAIRQNPGSEGSSYDVDIEYTYEVEGREFRGTRVRYYKLWTREWVARFVDGHPAGAVVTVYFDPSSPEDSVLLRDTDGGPLFAVMFLLPFNVGALVLGGILALILWGDKPRKPLKIVADGEFERIRLSPWHPVAPVGMAIFGTSSVAVFSITCCGGLPPSIATMVVAWLFVATVSAIAYRSVARRIAMGLDDLVIDLDRKELVLPALFGRKEPIIVPFADVDAVEVNPESDSDGDRKFQVVVRVFDSDRKLHNAKLVEWPEERDANELAEWLRDRVGPIRSE